jgi:hypothetical protein
MVPFKSCCTIHSFKDKVRSSLPNFADINHDADCYIIFKYAPASGLQGTWLEVCPDLWDEMMVHVIMHTKISRRITEKPFMHAP